MAYLNLFGNNCMDSAVYIIMYIIMLVENSLSWLKIIIRKKKKNRIWSRDIKKHTIQFFNVQLLWPFGKIWVTKKKGGGGM